MSQSRSHGKRAPTSSRSQPAVARAGSLDATSSSQRSQSIEDIKNDIGALEQKFSRLEKELNDSNKEYNSSVEKAGNVYRTSLSKAYKDHVAKLFDIYKNSKPEDTKKQEYEEIVSAVQKQVDDIQENSKANVLTTRPEANVGDATRRVKAKAIREKPELIKKLNGTTEGMQAVEDTEAKLSYLLDRFENNILKIDEQYSEKTGNLYKQHKEIEDILNKMNIPKVPPGSRAEAIERAGSKDLQELLEKTKEKNKNDERRKLLKK